MHIFHLRSKGKVSKTVLEISSVLPGSRHLEPMSLRVTGTRRLHSFAEPQLVDALTAQDTLAFAETNSSEVPSRLTDE